MNPIHSFKYVTYKQVDFLIAVYYYEFLALIAVDRGVSLKLIEQFKANDQELSAIIPISRKTPDYLLIGTSTLRTFSLNVAD